jgi:hypothetical protein
MATRKSCPGIPSKAAKLLDFSLPWLGHSLPYLCPTHCPPQEEAATLGTPLTIGEVASLIGCSPWTVRQRYLPAGLPHHRLTANGKLIFYRNQVVRWLITRQQKGGMVL